MVRRILLSLLGAAFILWGIGLLALGIYGTSAPASVTNVRRLGGERNEARAGQYMYEIGYRFVLSDQRQINGSFYRSGNAIFLKSGSGRTFVVRYIAEMPWLHAPNEQTQLSLRQPILIGVGVLLIVLINRRHRIQA